MNTERSGEATSSPRSWDKIDPGTFKISPLRSIGGAKLKERYGNKLAMDEPVISPARIFDSDLLQTVVER